MAEKKEAIDMCEAVRDMINKGKEAGRADERTSIVVNMFNMNIPIETIALMVNDSVENVKQMLASAGIAVK